MSEAESGGGAGEATYPVREVARLVEGLTAAQVRGYVRAGFVTPRIDVSGRAQFTFQDIVLIRMARKLEVELPPRRVREALRQLRTQVPANQPLSGVRLEAAGRAVVALDGTSTWEPATGQIRLELAPDAEEGPGATVTPLFGSSVGPMTGDLYEEACALELEGDPATVVAYLRVLEADPDHADAHINLGRLVHETGDAELAETHYRAALRRRPGDTLASFNLGVALEDQSRFEEAVAMYEQVLTTDPDFADAHFNAAQLCERLGRERQALEHLRSYRKLTR